MADTYERSYTPREFCDAERIGLTQLYAEWSRGCGPRFYRNGKRRIIPHSARIEYQQRKMVEAEGGVDESAA
jgi:hypothetical protein